MGCYKKHLQRARQFLLSFLFFNKFNFFLFESKVISAVYSVLTAVGWIVSGAKAEFVGKNKAVTPQEM